VVAVSSRVFLPTVRLDEALIGASDDLLKDDSFKPEFSERFRERGKW
jgi:hypothetical protein